MSLWEHFARPGPTLTGGQRIAMLSAVRGARSWPDGTAEATQHLATTLYRDPGAVDEHVVRESAEDGGDPRAVEVIATVSMLSAVDGTHRALGLPLEPLPMPHDGEPTGAILEGLRRRRTHVPMPAGPIPVALDLLPDEGAAFQSLFGPQYMTGREMAFDDFARVPGLDRAQMEVVSMATSIHNECFY